MFSTEIVESDAFLEMPISTQALYFHLGMNADDDGFVSPKRVMRVIGAADDDLKMLKAKRFILPFETGVVVIKHWLIHNLIRADMYKETLHKNEKNILGLNESGAYTELRDGVSPLRQIEPPEWLKRRRGELCTANGTHAARRLGKVRIGKDSITTNIKQVEVKKSFDDFWLMYPRKVEKKKAKEKWDRLNWEVQEKILKDIPSRLEDEQWKRGYIPHPTTYLNGERWNDEIVKEKPLLHAPQRQVDNFM